MLQGCTMNIMLNDQEKLGLFEALDDEHRAWATYDQVIKTFGPVRPFINIREAEARHIAAVAGLLQRYGLQAPGNAWIGNVRHYPSVAAACLDGITAEIANAALYDRLMASTDREDILAVYRALQEASQQRHLPAFQRCSGVSQPADSSRGKGCCHGHGASGSGRSRGQRHQGGSLR
mgnify:CR=1 FL=1